VTFEGDLYRMDFPSRPPVPVELAPQYGAAVGCEVEEAHLSRDLLLVARDEAAVRTATPDFDALAALPLGFGVILTAAASTSKPEQKDIGAKEQTDCDTTQQTDCVATEQTDCVATEQTDCVATEQTDCFATEQTDFVATEQTDFVSRFFVPKGGVDEDPVTGSSHSTLIPFWAARLGKNVLVAKQVSSRGGTLYCEQRGGRVGIAGRAVLYLSGEMHHIR